MLGRIGYDLYAEDRNTPLDRVRHFRSGVGGSSANIAVGLARLGCQVHMLGAVSEDALGRFLLENLRLEGVDISLAQSVRGHNVSLSLTEVSPPHSFNQVFYRADPADAHLAWTEAQGEVIRRSHVFVTNGTSLCASPSRETTLRALQVAREAGVITVFDVDYRASSWSSPAEAGAAAQRAWPWIDLLLANTDEMWLLAPGGVEDSNEGGTAAAALASGVRLVMWKQGENGATCFAAEGQIHVPAFQVPVTSTIGAGDGFAAGFIFAYAQGKPLRECLRYANACAACVVREVGCADAMPTLDQLEDLVRQDELAASGAEFEKQMKGQRAKIKNQK